MRIGPPIYLFIAIALLGIVTIAATCSEIWSPFGESSDSNDLEYEEPPPACRSWKEVGLWMRAIAADPRSEQAATAWERFRNHADSWWLREKDPLLWLVWLEVQLARRPELVESTGFRPGEEIFRIARRSHGFRMLVHRLRRGGTVSGDGVLLDMLQHPELYDAALEGLEVAGGDPASTRTLIDVIATRDDPRGVPALVRVTERGPEHRRTYASQSVARLQDPRTILLCIHKLGSDTRVERFSAHTALVRITGEDIARKDWQGWVDHWELHRDRYPEQLLPPEWDEAAILKAAREAR